MEIGAIILCGGKSSRMGKDKGLLPFYSAPMVSHIVKALQSYKIPINLVTSNKDYEQFGIELISDIYENKGPIGGIHAGLTASKYDVNIVISCDTPLVPAGLFKMLLNKYVDEDALVIEIQERTHPLIGIYNKRIVPILETLIEDNQLRLSQLLDRIKTRKLDLSTLTTYSNEYLYANMNRIEEVKEMQEEVEIRFFGMIAEQLNMSSTKISLKVVQESKLLRPLLESYFPQLENASYLIAIDHTIKEELKESEYIKEISILPPFAGG